MRNENTNLTIKITIIGMLVLMLIIIISLYFSDFNIGNKIGFNATVTSLTP